MKKYLTKNNLLYLSQTISMLAGVIAIAYGSYLNFNALIVIIIYALTIIPLIIRSFIKQSKSLNRFTLLCVYLTNIIPIFLQRTKIRYTLGELYELTEGEIKETILEAIIYIDNTKDDPDLLRNGLKIIEDKFPNSRVRSIHKFLLTVEDNNSLSYKKIADDLYEDVDSWIKRTVGFQKDLKNRQTKILLLCLITLIMNVMFVFIYVSNDYFEGFVNNNLYQISTTIFIGLVLLIIAIIVIKLNGEWLIDDINKKNEEEFKKKYRYYKQGKQKLKWYDALISILISIGGCYFLYLENNFAGIALILISLIFISQKPRKYAKAKNYIKRMFTIEFPIWLREVSLSLGNLTVLNSIDYSLKSASYPLRREIRYFLDEAGKNPTSIKPYNDFLSEYQIDEVKSSMRVLYAINSVSKSEMQDRTSRLIERNQDLLAKSELIRNNDSIGGIEMIGYIPTLLFSVQMMASMIIMFDYMLSVLGGAL